MSSALERMLAGELYQANDPELVALERIRVMNITLKGLGVGDWRELTENEDDRKLIGHQGSL